MNEKETGIIAKKEDNFSEWYIQVVRKAELADYGPVQGTIAFMPNSYALWERIQSVFDSWLKKTGHRNAYFPLLIPENFLTREKEHFTGFVPEVFWVTHNGDNKVGEKLAVRPTSETIIYDFYSRWVRSWRDLPLLLNQWCNILRAEIKSTKPFVRTSEFLWQEGHTVHETEAEAVKEVRDILEMYVDLVKNYLAIPVYYGKKSEMEKFAGAVYTTTLEGMMPDGKALQIATSHNLGQNFSKAFGIEFLDKENKKQYGWQTSWGISTRVLGALIMIHSDNKGLVIPPKIAPIQVVIVPVYKTDQRDMVMQHANSLLSSLTKEGLTVHLDGRDDRTPGWKFNDWELKGIPLRIEMGPRDIAKDEVLLARRDTGEKSTVKTSEASSAAIKLLDDIQDNLLKRAKEGLSNQTTTAESYDQLKKTISGQGGFVKAGWCGSGECELKIKEETGATIRVIPFESQGAKSCVYCGKKADSYAYFARSY
jgi:prolyl-tRNA synthetase